jgi:hypothetical protein
MHLGRETGERNGRGYKRYAGIERAEDWPLLAKPYRMAEVERQLREMVLLS